MRLHIVAPSDGAGQGLCELEYEPEATAAPVSAPPRQASATVARVRAAPVTRTSDQLAGPKRLSIEVLVVRSAAGVGIAAVHRLRSIWGVSSQVDCGDWHVRRKLSWLATPADPLRALDLGSTELTALCSKTDYKNAAPFRKEFRMPIHDHFESQRLGVLST